MMVTNSDQQLWIETISGWRPPFGIDRYEIRPGRYLLKVRPTWIVPFFSDAKYAVLRLDAKPGHIYKLRRHQGPDRSWIPRIEDVAPSELGRETPPGNELDHACRTGHVSSCVELGELYERGSMEVGWDERRAAALLRKACASGHVVGCFSLARLYETGHGVTKDEAVAAEMFKSACIAGEARACTRWGDILQGGPSQPRDQRKAQAPEPLKAACDSGAPAACYWVAVFIRENQGGSVDQGLLATLYEKACTGGEPRACAELGLLYESGIGVELSEHRAAALYGKACAGGSAMGCSYLGGLYQLGRGVTKDPDRAIELHKKGCAAGAATACATLETLDPKASKTHLKDSQKSVQEPSFRPDFEPLWFQLGVRGDWELLQPSFLPMISAELGTDWYSIVTAIVLAPLEIRFEGRWYPMMWGPIRPYLAVGGLSFGGRAESITIGAPLRLALGMDVRISGVQIFTDFAPLRSTAPADMFGPGLLSLGAGWRF
ncbi:MAG TPA: tetratricopeptide repeat protein [Gemmatimonadales bacterium]|nr:tetratricopeptide repeat protein [Gemmatimonadales bacterium]